MLEIDKFFYIIKNVLDKKKILFFYIIIFLSLLASILEMIGIGMIFPIIGTFLSENFFEKYENFKFLNQYLVFSKENNSILFFLLIIFIFYVFKFFYLLFVKYTNFKYIFFTNSLISNKIFKIYLNSKYLFHVSNQQSELLKNVMSEPNSVCQGYMTNLFNFFLEVVIFISIITLLLIIETKITLIILFSFSLVICIYFIVLKKKLLNIGKSRIIIENKRISTVLNALNGIKEIILTNKINYFENKLVKENLNFLKLGITQSFLMILPTLIFELLIISAIILSIGVFFIFNKTLDEIILILTLYGFASLKLLPSFSRITSSFQSIPTYIPSINLVYDILKMDKLKKNNLKLNNEEVLFNNSLNINNISINLKSKPIILNQSLKIEKYSKIGIFGPSGSGKSTLLNIISGLISPNQGYVEIDGKKLREENIYNWHKIIGYVSQNTFLYNDTIVKNIILDDSKEYLNDISFKNAIMLSRSNDFIEKFENKYEYMVGDQGLKLSDGQKQRIGLARALYRNPSILLLDEFTNSLDETNENNILNDIFALKDITIIFVSHKINILKKYCNNIYELKNKKLNKI